MSSETTKKRKLGFSKYRALLWLIMLGGAFGLFVMEFDPNMKVETGSFRVYAPRDEDQSSRWFPADEDITDKSFFIYKTTDLTKEENEKLYRNRNKNLSSGYYSQVKDYKGYSCIGYRRGNMHGVSIAIGIVLPMVLILLTLLFERPIVRKLVKMNS